jgi:superfamily I DNA/RNA helicase
MVAPLRFDAGRFRELDVLERLRDHLPAQFEVFHSIGLHSLQGPRDRYGEIDVAVLAPNGCLLLIEVKAGAVVLRDGGIFKLYGDGESDVARQSITQRAVIQNRLLEAGLRTPVLSCLVLPDYTLGATPIISMPRERIIDATRFDTMVTLVRDWLGALDSQVDRPALRRLLLNQFRVTPHMDVLRDQLQHTVRQLSDGLATWVPRVASRSGIFRVQATAGSGKTQLALHLLDTAASASIKAMYVCFNRSLADCVRDLAPARVEVTNFHDLCVEHHRRHHGEPDFGAAGAFDGMADAYHQASAHFPSRLDMLVIDEAQDFAPGWVESVCSLLTPGGKLYLLEDEDQRIYPKEDFDLEDAVVIRCRDNFRTPRAICDVINALALAPAIRSMNPYRGEAPEIYTYETDGQLIAAVTSAIDALLAQGFALADIAIVTGRGRDKSLLLNRPYVGTWSTRRFTGDFDSQGVPLWTDGELLVESVYRYKGQSAPAVIVAEFDFVTLDERTRRKLFVALTRAQMAAALVLSASAERCLLQVITANAEV